MKCIFGDYFIYLSFSFVSHYTYKTYSSNRLSDLIYNNIVLRYIFKKNYNKVILKNI